MLQYSVEDKELNEALEKLALAARSPITEFDLADVLYDDFLDMERDWFASAGFGSWPELAASTLLRKLQFLGSVAYVSPMRFTDRLFESLTVPGAQDAVKEVSPNNVSFGTSRPYAAAHMRASGKRPARPPVPTELPAEHGLKMGQTIQRQARAYVRELGFLGFVQRGPEL